jgi:hypothetical protein
MDALRQRGDQLVRVSELADLALDQVMPAARAGDRALWPTSARVPACSRQLAVNS